MVEYNSVLIPAYDNKFPVENTLFNLVMYVLNGNTGRLFIINLVELNKILCIDQSYGE